MLQTSFLIAMAYETEHSKIGKINYGKTAFKKLEVIWSVLTDHINSNFLMAVFPILYLVHS